MKRLYTVLVLVVILAALAVPALAGGGTSAVPAGATADGWTWDEM